MIFAFGTICRFLDRTSSIASSENGIDVSLCGLDRYWLIVIISIIINAIFSSWILTTIVIIDTKYIHVVENITS